MNDRFSDQVVFIADAQSVTYLSKNQKAETSSFLIRSICFLSDVSADHQFSLILKKRTANKQTEILTNLTHPI